MINSRMMNKNEISRTIIRVTVYVMIIVTVIYCNLLYARAETTIWTGEYYYIASALNWNKVLDVSGGSCADGANLQLYDINGSDAQLFRIEYTSNGFFKIINKGSGKAIDVCEGNFTMGANIHMWEDNGTKAQQWSIYQPEEWPDEFVVIVNQSGLYMDVCGGCTTNGTNIQLWEGNGTDSQIFKLIPYKQTADTFCEDYRLEFDNVEEWMQQVRCAEMSAIGCASFITNLDGEQIYNGRMITGVAVMEYKEIPVNYTNMGVTVTETISLPSVIRYQIHQHNYGEQFVWVDFSNVTINHRCSCGATYGYKWAIPYPIEDNVTKSFEFNGIRNFDRYEQRPF